MLQQALQRSLIQVRTTRRAPLHTLGGLMLAMWEHSNATSVSVNQLCSPVHKEHATCRHAPRAKRRDNEVLTIHLALSPQLNVHDRRTRGDKGCPSRFAGSLH